MIIGNILYTLCDYHHDNDKMIHYKNNDFDCQQFYI